MRAQYMLSPQAFERLVPYAELYDIRVGIEIHNPESPLSPLMKRIFSSNQKDQVAISWVYPRFWLFCHCPQSSTVDKSVGSRGQRRTSATSS